MNPQSRAGSAAAAGIEPAVGERDFELGVAGFRFRDLYDVHRLPDLAHAFDRFLKEASQETFRLLELYRRDHESLGPVETSQILVQVAPWVSRFIGVLFGIVKDQAAHAALTASEEPVMRFRREFVQRRVAKKFGPGAKNPYPTLSGHSVIWPEDLAGLMAAADAEKALAGYLCDLLDREKLLAAAAPLNVAALEQVRAKLAAAEQYVGALLGEAGQAFARCLVQSSVATGIKNLA